MRVDYSLARGPAGWRLCLMVGIASGLFAAPLARAADGPNSKAGTLGVAMKPKAHRGPRADPPGTLAPAAPIANAAAGLRNKYSGTPVDVMTYHYDNSRTGWNQTETDLTPASVSSGKFGLLTTLAVDGNVFAQPLLVSGFVMPDHSKHDVLIVATGHDTVYAYDAQTYAVLWQKSLGISQTSNDVGCTDVVPEYGISSTPVIQRSGAGRATLYITAATEPKPYAFHLQLHALDLGTGADTEAPAEIAPSATLANGSTIAFDGQNQWNRAGLAMNNGTIYVGIGSHCDNASSSISGWVVAYNKKLALKNAFHTIETPASTELASVWMTGFAPAIDASGNVFVVTGNGNYNLQHKGRDYGESVLSLSPSLGAVHSSFTPSNYQSLNDNDYDAGSGGVMLIPPVQGQAAPPLAVALGKWPILYLLNSTALGGYSKTDAGALQALLTGVDGGVWGGPAYYQGASGGTIFYQLNNDVLRAFSVNTGSSPGVTLSALGTSQAGYGGSLPIVSSNGAQAGTGIVWLVRRTLSPQLEAYDASKLGAPLFAATAGTWGNSANNAFVTPLEANGRVYVGTTGTVDVFGLTP